MLIKITILIIPGKQQSGGTEFQKCVIELRSVIATLEINVKKLFEWSYIKQLICRGFVSR